VDVTKFKAGLIAINVLLDTPLSEAQIKKLHQSNDKVGQRRRWNFCFGNSVNDFLLQDSGGLVNYEDFLNSFSVKDTAKLKP
jgi:hypothetical protein